MGRAQKQQVLGILSKWVLGILSKWVPPLPQYPQCKYAFVVDVPAELSK